jgi:hypothetical protein
MFIEVFVSGSAGKMKPRTAPQMNNTKMQQILPSLFVDNFSL